MKTGVLTASEYYLSKYNNSTSAISNLDNLSLEFFSNLTFVVVSVDHELFSPPYRHLRDVGHEVSWDARGVFPNFPARVSTDRVEVSQQHHTEFLQKKKEHTLRIAEGQKLFHRARQDSNLQSSDP